MKPLAIQLRKATAADFPIFYQFHTSLACDWLMFGFNIMDSRNLECTEKDEAEIAYFSTFENFFFNEFDLSRFQEYLKWYQIFIIETSDTGEALGYVQMERHSSKQIIRRWQMEPKYRNEDILSAILAECEKKQDSKCKGMQVIAMSDDAANFLASHGYTSKVRPFFEKMQT